MTSYKELIDDIMYNLDNNPNVLQFMKELENTHGSIVRKILVGIKNCTNVSKEDIKKSVFEKIKCEERELNE